MKTRVVCEAIFYSEIFADCRYRLQASSSSSVAAAMLRFPIKLNQEPRNP